jgi:FkbM family methyltransferase
MKFLQKIIRLLIRPFEFNYRVALFTKGAILEHQETHILALIDYIRRHNIVTKEAIVIDAGNFKGETLKLFSSYFPNNKIFGFEPHPEHYLITIKNVNDYSNIKVFNSALGPRSERVSFNLGRLSDSSSILGFNSVNNQLSQVEIDMICLDDFTKEIDEILILKLDIEGFEVEALKGANQTLKKTRYVTTEMNNQDFHSNGCQYYEVDDLLRNKGFKLIAIHSDYNHQGLSYYDATYANLNL